MDGAIRQLERAGWLSAAWLGDPVSEAVRVHYNRVAVEGEGSALHALRLYRDELQKIADELGKTDAGYKHAEASATADLNRIH
jgi:hypothetical protein